MSEGGVESVLADLSQGWGQRFDAKVNELGFDLAGRRRLIADLAWTARREGAPIPDLEAGAPIAAVYFVAQRLRFDFRFIELDHVLDRWLRVHHDDALLLGLAALAAHGLGRHDASSLVDRALSRPDADTKTRHLCLHALWFSAEPTDLEQAVSLAEEMVRRGEDSGNTRFRMAGALRRLDRHDEALREIDQAMRLLGHDQPDVHQDYARERELIVATRELQAKLSRSEETIRALAARLEDHMAVAVDDIDRRLVRAEDVVADGLLRTVEIIGLFVALVTFAFGAGIASFTVEGWNQLLPLLGFLLLGSAGFLVLLRVVVSWPRRRPSSRR